MARLDYFTQLSPDPIKLSIGTIRKPKLKDISIITFEKFNYLESFLKLTPEIYFTKLLGQAGIDYWNSLSDEEKDSMTTFDLIKEQEKLREVYLELFRFFFVEPIIYEDGFFIILVHNVEDITKIQIEDIRGVINEKTFPQVIDLLQQICCIHKAEESIEGQKFKNNLARKIFERMLKAKQKEDEVKKADLNLTIPNIISAISSKHPSINLINVWDLTIFQLLDQFSRLRVNTMFDISCRRVSTWGDEKKTFDAALWYKNEYDKT